MNNTFYLFEDLIIIPSTNVDTNLLNLLNIDEKSVVTDSIHDITVINLFKNQYLKGDDTID